MSLDDLLNQRGGLTERLRQTRKASGLTGDALAIQLHWVRSKVSKLENGRQMPTLQDIREWVAACDVSDEDAADMESMLSTASAEHRQWQHRLRRGGETGLQTGMDELVRASTVVKNFETFFVPGLLQTSGYAHVREAENARLHGFSAEAAGERVAARMRRQEVLYESSDRQFTFVMLEFALQPLLTPPDVMLGQLDRLLALAGSSSIRFGVVPAERLPFPPLTGFLLLDDDYVVVESFASSIRVQGEEAAAYVGVMDQLLAAALTGDDARQFILATADKIRST